VRLLVEPVLPALPYVAGVSLLDVGAGNGSPGLVLGLLRPDLALTLLEPRQKRWAFLREAARRAGRRTGIDVRRERHDQYPGPPADTVTRRAVALGPAALAPLVAAGGRLLVWGPPPAAEAGWAAETVAPGLHVLRQS
jgi:16S rRNA G527 N7-methylase RsmG